MKFIGRVLPSKLVARVLFGLLAIAETTCALSFVYIKPELDRCLHQNGVAKHG